MIPAMGKDSGGQRSHPRTGRVRGLHDIRTLGNLSRTPTLSRASATPGFRIGAGFSRREQPTIPCFPEEPRTWVFVKQHCFSRRQGMLLVDRITEPEVDVFDEGLAVVVLAELTGAREQDIELHVNGDVLTLETKPGSTDFLRYYREILLPFPVAAVSIQRAFRNGVLEIELERESDQSRSRRETT